MNSIATGVISAVSIIGAVLLGFLLQKVLPSNHLSAESKETIKLSAGLIATMTALVLGLLVSSAKNSFDATRNGTVLTALLVCVGLKSYCCFPRFHAV